MPQFTTISPTHVAGQKPAAWVHFREGHYVAIGWLEDVDLTGTSMDEITDVIRRQEYDNETAAIQSFGRFLSLQPGDYVAVNNTNHGLFGIGIIESGYKFRLQKHDSGDAEEFYRHIGMLSGSKPHTCPAVLLFQKARHPGSGTVRWERSTPIDALIYPACLGFHLPLEARRLRFCDRGI